MKDGVTVAIDATTRTFDLNAKKFDDKAFAPIAEVAEVRELPRGAGHELPRAELRWQRHRLPPVPHHEDRRLAPRDAVALDRLLRPRDPLGPGVRYRRHQLQGPVQALKYEHHIGIPYPTHGITNCESCHVKGMYNVPSQSKSLPGLLSASDTVTSTTRLIDDVPATVTGPAARACGGCHRAELIKEDAAGDLAILRKHMEMGGYLIPAGSKPVDTLMGVINQVMTLFK